MLRGMTDGTAAAKYRLPIVVMVFNNPELAVINHAREDEGHPGFAVGINNPNVAMDAEACGGLGFRERRDSSTGRWE